jgi:signal transduction histidine kinase
MAIAVSSETSPPDARVRSEDRAAPDAALSDLDRDRIVRDVHDGVLQDLSGAAFNLAALGRSAVVDPAAVTEVAETVRSSITSMRCLLAEISPQHVTDDGSQHTITRGGDGRPIERVRRIPEPDRRGRQRTDVPKTR